MALGRPGGVDSEDQRPDVLPWGVVAVLRHAEGPTLEAEVDRHPRIIVALASPAGVGKAVLPQGNGRRDHNVSGVRPSATEGAGLAIAHPRAALAPHHDLQQKGPRFDAESMRHVVLGRRGNGIISEWQRRFDDAIVLPDGGELVTLLDAGIYIESLPEAQYRRREWRIATEMLLAVADGRWPPRFAEIAIRQALKTGRPPPLPAARRKA